MGHDKENTMPKKKKKGLTKKDFERFSEIRKWADSLTQEQIDTLPEEIVREIENLDEGCRRIKVVLAIQRKKGK